MEWLYSLQTFGIKLGVERVQELLQDWGLIPPEGVFIIHVAGTNGKGSTCAFAEALMLRMGKTTGLFTSPHLVRFNERMRVMGKDISDEKLYEYIRIVRGRVEKAAEQGDIAPTFFEVALILALMFFLEEGVEVIILETGMGGRLDATNAIPKDVAVLTPIAMDHTQYLGSTLGEIAAEKAAIIHPGNIVISCEQAPEARDVIKARLHTCHIPASGIKWVQEDSALPELVLEGDHQRVNALLAWEAVQALYPDNELTKSRSLLRRALNTVCWQGRFQRISPLDESAFTKEQLKKASIILDGAHNQHATRALVKAWKEEFPDGLASVIYATSADKDIQQSIRLLNCVAKEWILPPGSSPRLMPPADLAALVLKSIQPDHEQGGNLYGSALPNIRVASSLKEALELTQVPENKIIITGSLFLVGDVLALAENQDAYPTVQ